MASSHDTSGDIEIVDSMATVEFDAESNLFRAVYDSTHDSPSLAVVAVISTALGKDPMDLPPLQSAFDTDAFDELFSELANGVQRSGRISFCYEGFRVTVFSEGIIEADQIENT